jgi:hypothetical protein
LISPATNLYVTLGRADGVTDLMALTKVLADMSGVDNSHFTGAGEVRDHSAHLEVDNEVADKIIAAVHGKARPGQPPPAAAVTEGEPPAEAAPIRTIVCERAKSQPGDRRRRSGGGDRDRDRDRDRGGRGGGRGRGPRR